MGIFRYAEKSEYQDLLRAIGHYLDQQGFRLVRIIETEDGGLIIQGNTAPGHDQMQVESYFLSPGDIEEMTHQAIARRGKKI